MKVLVSDDETCRKYGNDYYLSDFGLTLARRYLMVYDEIRFVIRVREVTKENELGKYRNKVIDKRIEIFQVPFFQGPKQFAKLFFKISSALHKLADGCSICYLRLPSTTAFLVWRIIRNKVPYAVELVADASDLYKASDTLVTIFVWRIMHIMTIQSCNHSLGIACVTKDYLQKHYTSKIPGAVFSHYSSIEMLPSFRYNKRKYPNHTTFNVILVANQVFLDSAKGHKLMIDVTSILKEKGTIIHLVFAGENYFNGFSQIQQYAFSKGVDDQIELTGFLTSLELREKLINSDIMVLPTKTEGLPRSLIEGMALGLPCVTTPVSGNLELIDNRFLVNYVDENQFAEKLYQLITNPLLYEEQSLINFERSREYCKDVLDERRKNFYIKVNKLLINKK